MRYWQELWNLPARYFIPMKVLTFSLLSFLFCLSGTGLFAQSAPQLEAAAFKEKTASGKYLILDVRTAGEYASGHIEGAINLDINRADFQQEAKKLDPNRPVLVYCLSGIRSDRAARVLLSQGVKNVYNLRGGTRAWTAAGLPLIR